MVREFMVDSHIKKISKGSRYVVLNKQEGLPLFLGVDCALEVPESIPIRVVYKEGEIIIRKK